MRRCYLVCYDIADPKRLRLVHKTLKGYGEAWQYSIFFCVLKDIDHIRLQVELEELTNEREDRVMILDLGSNEKEVRAATTIIGRAPPEQDEGVVVI